MNHYHAMCMGEAKIFTRPKNIQNLYLRHAHQINKTYSTKLIQSDLISSYDHIEDYRKGQGPQAELPDQPDQSFIGEMYQSNKYSRTKRQLIF